MKKHNIIISAAIVGLSLGLAGCHKAKKPTVESPARVEVMAARESSLASSRAYSGTIEESSGTDLSFEVPGQIRSINVSQGDRVQKGQVVATMDNTSLQNAYNIAKSGLDEAQDVYNRMKKLHDSNSLPEMKWVEAQNALSSAKSSEAIARKTLSNATLYAPFSGYVSEKSADAGSVTAPGLPVVRLVVIDPIKVNVSVSEEDINKIAEGQSAQMTIASLPGTTFQGKVTERGVSANPISRTYDVKVTIANPDGKLLPGMICDLRFESQDSTMAIVVPYPAVLLDANNNNFVWLAKDGKASKRVVKVGQMLDQGLSIVDGLAVGDSIIVVGQQKVSQDGKIEIINVK